MAQFKTTIFNILYEFFFGYFRSRSIPYEILYGVIDFINYSIGSWDYTGHID